MHDFRDVIPPFAFDLNVVKFKNENFPSVDRLVAW